MLTIAVTASSYKIKGGNHLWCNGITQNSIFMTMMIDKMGHRGYLIHPEKKALADTPCMPSDLRIIDLDDAMDTEFDIILFLGHTFPASLQKKYRERFPHCKFVMYVCGNVFVHVIETVLYKNKDTEARATLPKYEYDEIWIIPQMEKTSIDWLRFYYNTDKVTVVPFLWSPYLGEKYLEETAFQEYAGQPLTSVGVCEPNISVAKHFLFPVMVAEQYLRKEGAQLQSLMVFCADRFKTNRNVLESLSQTELIRQKKISIEHRYPILSVLNKWANVILSFQWENPLNYLYLDAAWFGFAVVHNADYCQDIGYFYNGWSMDEATAALTYAFENHAKDTTYKSRMRALLTRYTDNNPNLLRDYDLLFTNALTGKFRKYTYNWRMNTIF